MLDQLCDEQLSLGEFTSYKANGRWLSGRFRICRHVKTELRLDLAPDVMQI